MSFLRPQQVLVRSACVPQSMHQMSSSGSNREYRFMSRTRNCKAVMSDVLPLTTALRSESSPRSQLWQSSTGLTWIDDEVSQLQVSCDPNLKGTCSSHKWHMSAAGGFVIVIRV